MALNESYHCDVCGKEEAHADKWWLGWLDCSPVNGTTNGQPMIKLTRFEKSMAHGNGEKHLCGARCASTMVDRWLSDQHENPDSTCDV